LRATDKEQYLREYDALKKKGKPFFPYAVLKDSTMAFVVLIVVVLMSLVLGAEQGPKVDPTTTTYVPRPEWYFFFLFELLRVVKPPELVFLATIGTNMGGYAPLFESPVHRLRAPLGPGSTSPARGGGGGPGRGLPAASGDHGGELTPRRITR